MYQANTEAFQEEFSKLVFKLKLAEIALEAASTPNEGEAEIQVARYEDLILKFEEGVSTLFVSYISALQEEIIEDEDDYEAAYDFVENLVISLLSLLRCPINN